MNELEKKLFELSEASVKLYDQNIVKGDSPFIGVRIPQVRKITSNLIKNNQINNFFEEYNGKYFEEKLVKGIIIASKEEYFLRYNQDYITELDSWCLVDTFCINCKFIEKNKDKYWKYIKDLINSDKEFIIRLGYVFILNYYLIDDYINEVLELCLRKYDYYYVNMAIAWLISEAFITYPSKVEELLNLKKLDIFIQNKAIDKINDSFRVNSETKVRLRELKYF